MTVSHYDWCGKWYLAVDAEELYLVRKREVPTPQMEKLYLRRPHPLIVVISSLNTQMGSAEQIPNFVQFAVYLCFLKCKADCRQILKIMRMLWHKIRSVQDDLSKVSIIDPIPAKMRLYSRIVDSKLRRDCANISATLYALSQKKDAMWERFEKIVKSLPENEIKEIDFVTTAIGDVILVEKEETGNSFAKIDAARLSDGTLRCIAALASVMSAPENSLVIVEEVDNGIHPSRAKKLMSAMSAIVKERNIALIVTTHNVTVLNGLDKEGILGVAVTYRDAETKASKIIPFVDIQNQAGLLAIGGVGDALASDTLIRAIKDKAVVEPFAF